MYEFGAFPGLYTLVASAVGGGSTAYGGLLVPPTNTAIWRERHPELDPADIERYYDKVIDDMGGVRLSREHALPQSVWTHFPGGAERRCRPADPQPYMGVLLPRDRGSRQGPRTTVAPPASSVDTVRSTATVSSVRAAAPRRRSTSFTWRPCWTRESPSATCAR